MYTTKQLVGKCQYCEGIPELVDSSVIYGKSYGKIYLCPLCRAYVGCHKGTDRPKGTVADRELRALRAEAHALFDPVWLNRELDPKASRRTNRHLAYRRMAEILAVSLDEAHIAMMSRDNCLKLIESLKNRLELKMKE